MQGTCILAAEDNEVNRMVLEHSLIELGVPVHFAEDGQKAVDMAEALNPSVILMDVSMPVLNGMEATQKIRAQETDGVRVPIIAVTAHALKGDRERFMEAGMDDYISKPISPDDLIAKVRQYL